MNYNDHYNDLKNKILALIDGRVTVTVKTADLDPTFVEEVKKAKFRVNLSMRDRMLLSFNYQGEPTIKFSMV